MFAQSGGSVLLIPTQPLAHGGRRRGEGSGRGFDPVLAGVLD